MDTGQPFCWSKYPNSMLDVTMMVLGVTKVTGLNFLVSCIEKYILSLETKR